MTAVVLCGASNRRYCQLPWRHDGPHRWDNGAETLTWANNGRAVKRIQRDSVVTLEADAALIAVGTWVRSKTIVNSYDEPVAGIVCDIYHLDRVDDETGELTEITRYRCRDCNDPDPLRIRVLDGADIDPGDAWPASTYDIARLVRRVCFDVGKAKSRTARAARELNEYERCALTDALTVLAAIS